MPAPQRIARVRRRYNQWVANETLEDFALRFTAKRARKWSPFQVANTALGAISFLALEAIGAAITLSYGFTNAVWAILVVGALIFLTGLPISYYAAKYGVDMDLLTRGAGFGYIGSTITSLIYATFTFIFFALEAAIMSMALEMYFEIPLTIAYVISALVVIPLVTHGITLISRFQIWTQPLWLLLHILPFVFVALHSPGLFSDWTTFVGRQGETSGTFNLLLFGAAASVIFALIAQIGEQVDFLRFLPRERRGRRLHWWLALLAAGPGWIVLGVLKLLAGSFLAFLALQHLIPADKAVEPTQMYLVAFGYVFGNPETALAATALFVIVSQLKINVTNAYAGSIAWSNFFARLTHSHPGRVVWLVFNVAIALLLMELGVFTALEHVLGLYANVAIAWVGALVADLVINKPLRLSPAHIEFKRAHLYDINPVGVGAMLMATLVSVTAFTGLFGPLLQALSPFLALFVAFLCAPVIALLTRGRYYLARHSGGGPFGQETIHCRICEHPFEPEDMARCPAYGGPICSLCCSLDARCEDRCKEDARARDQLLRFLGQIFPARVVRALQSRLAHFLSLFLLLNLLIGALLALLYFQEMLNPGGDVALIGATLSKVFFVFVVVVGVITWLYVLAQESRRVSQEEMNRQTALLTREVEAHQRTDAQLQRAKELAEAANLAKSRYVTGMSHELRTPLNSMLGYTQLLQQNAALTKAAREGLDVIRRSGEHLSGLIDGLLDIAKIEAGKLHLHRNEIRFGDFLEQLVKMFELQAATKGLEFRFETEGDLPAVVSGDEKRLRQILINLLWNAVKFTDSGGVVFRARYHRAIAEFEVADSGIGIDAEDLQRIFAPFERGRRSGHHHTPGSGLGLTISKLLTEIMGGSITVASTAGQGSVFTVRVLLWEVTAPASAPRDDGEITGYAGPRRTVLVADDDPDHCSLMRQLLVPLGFGFFAAGRGDECLAVAEQCRPDLILLDITMPVMDGWEVARRLRARGHDHVPIIMVSANAYESRQIQGAGCCHSDFLVKPLDIRQLLDKIRQHLNLVWLRRAVGPQATMAVPHRPAYRLPTGDVDDLLQLGAIGYVRGIQVKLDEIAARDPAAVPVISSLREQVRQFRFKQYRRQLEDMRHEPA